MTARTETTIAAMENPQRKIFGVQFHPEVTHTENGEALLRRFVFDVCRCQGDWTIGSFIENAIERIRKQIGEWTRALRNQRRRGLDGCGDIGVARDRRPARSAFSSTPACCGRTSSKKFFRCFRTICT